MSLMEMKYPSNTVHFSVVEVQKTNHFVMAPIEKLGSKMRRTKHTNYKILIEKSER
jgi:hypothetical protein